MAKTNPAVAVLDKSPSHLLHRVLQLALDIYGEETGPGAMTQRQFAVMAAVAAHEGCTQSDLVRATGIDRSTLAELVARLIAKGLLARERSATDARANTVSLTDEGRKMIDDAGPRVEAADARILKLMPSARRPVFVKILRDIARRSEESGSAEKADKPQKAERKTAKGEKKKKGKKARKKAAAEVAAE